MRKSLKFLPLMVAAILVAGCVPQTPINERYGQILPPGTVPTPKGCLAYVTAPGDMPYLLAQRFYAAGYRSYLLEVQNKDTFKTILQKDGTLQKGKIIFLPPDQNGRPLDSKTPGKYYLGGWE